MGKMQVINPVTEEIENEFDTHTPAEVEQIIDDVAVAWEDWRRTDFATRAKHMNKVADLLEERADDLAQIMTREMGKPLSGGVGEAKKCAWACRYYAENAEELQKQLTAALEAGSGVHVIDVTTDYSSNTKDLL